MVRRQHFISKIRDLGYVYKATQKRTFLYRKQGGTHRMSVPRSDSLDDTYVRSALRQAKCSEAEIEAFIGEYRRDS